MEGVRYRTLPEKTADAISDYLYHFKIIFIKCIIY